MSTITTIIGVYLTLVCLFGSLLNGVSLLVICRYKIFKESKSMKPFLLSGIGLDLVTCLFTYPLSISSSFATKWSHSDQACTFYGFVNTWAAINSIFQLTGLAFDRYVTLTRPFQKLSMLGGRRPLIFAVALTFTSLLIAVLPFTGLSSYSKEGLQVSCSIDWIRNSTNDYIYYGVLFILGYLMPVSVQLICNLRFIRVLKVMSHVSKEKYGRRSSLAIHSDRSLRQMTFMVFVMSIAFQISWMPYALVTILRLFKVHLSPLLETLPSVFAKASVVLNPLIYCFMSKSFRSVFACCKHPDGNSESTETPKEKGPVDNKGM
uniref:C-like opsin n=1 Tax=Tripedalia cystophora TaxID=6141 RepID=A0A059NTG1_TRICY|nr:c-like opsin [Tripedalia cystophora]